MTITTTQLTKAADFIWHAARLIDRHRFAYLFLNGSREAVLSALRPYQNADGGFGNALEPDLRGPVSLPMPVWTALCILDEIAAFDDPMVKQACDYLMTITTSEGGVPFVLPSALAYPHAPWWQTEDAPPDSLNPTAAIAALLYKNGIDHPWLSLATTYCWRKLVQNERTDAYEARAIFPFLHYTPERSHAEQGLKTFGPKIFEQNLVALDVTAAEEVHTPLNFAPLPDSPARRLFSDDVIDAHLNALIASQQEDGGWPINWLVWTPATGLEWRGTATIEALKTLRAYGRNL